MIKDYKIYLNDILGAIKSIEEFLSGVDFSTFQSDDKTSSAVIRKLEILGEAAKQIPEDIRQRYPHIPWKEMAGMRDRLIHFYAGVDYRLVWETVQEKLPVVKESIKKLI
ncbi:MAG: DUF86 domain-containing protein [Candidatus Omnitrophica bacterium]|nr:DUF86 domain-containing protein [Candidatus Omnitrophota bacterium]